MPFDLGHTASGIVANENDWGGKNPAISRPRRGASGVVVGLFHAAPNVVQVRTQDNSVLTIRTELH